METFCELIFCPRKSDVLAYSFGWRSIDPCSFSVNQFLCLFVLFAVALSLSSGSPLKRNTDPEKSKHVGGECGWVAHYSCPGSVTLPERCRRIYS